MSKISYTAEPQRLVTGSGYQPCEPHQASRFVIIQTTSIAAKAGRRARHIKRTVAVLSSLTAAKTELAKLTGKTKPKPRKTIFRSLTLREFNLLGRNDA